MKSTKSKSTLTFFLLTFFLTLPIDILIVLIGKNIILSPDMVFAIVPLTALAPIGAALILTFRESGKDGVKKLLARVFDHKRIEKKIWYIPIFFLMPFLYLLAWGAAVLMEQPLIAAPFPIVALPVVILIFFIMALGEEIGWMGYAFEPMQNQWSTSKAALLLGLIWVLWHVPFWIFVFDEPIAIVGQALTLVTLRFLMVWLFNNTGKSVFVTILFHAVYNVTIGMLPVNTMISSLFLLVTVIVVIFLWGPETMAQFRRKKAHDLG